MSARTGAERISVLRMGDVLVAAIQQELTDRSALELQRDLTEMAAPGARGNLRGPHTARSPEGALANTRGQGDR